MKFLAQYIYRGAKDGLEGQPMKRAPHDHDHSCQCDRCLAYWDGWSSGVRDRAWMTIEAVARRTA